MPKGPQFLSYVIPIVEVLKENGGSGNTAEVIDKVIDKCGIPQGLEVILNSGQQKIRNRIQWAHFYLTKAGLIDSSKRGLWQLTDLGYNASLNTESVYKMFRDVHKVFEGKKKTSTVEGDNEDVDVEEVDIERVEDELHSKNLLKLLKMMSSGGFEKICKRLLTEIGIHDIVVTGKSNDGGIDGIGIIKLNDVVNFNIVFQCKRYKDTVAPHYVRDFRGAMQGRADKGLMLTTGRFTPEARKEANRDGVPPIELIDGERLVNLFEKYELGLKPITVYKIIPEFFKHFN